jgi:Ras-related protein Rab-1A
LVYDVTSPSSFEDIDRFWLNEVQSYAEKNVEMMLVGNKNDLTSQKNVSTEAAQEYANQKQMHFCEVSAKTADSVDLGFKKLIEQLMKKKASNSTRSTFQ